MKIMPLVFQWSRLFVSLLVGIISDSDCLCPTLGIFFDFIVVPPTPVYLRRVEHLVSGVLISVVVRRVYGRPIEMKFLRNLSNVCHQPLL